MKYVVSKFNDDGSIYQIYECEDEEEAMKTAYACNGVYEKVSPSITDNQQVVLDYLKNIYSDVYEDCTPLETMYLFGGRRAWSEESNLTDKEELQVLAAFASWGLNSCQNGNS